MRKEENPKKREGETHHGEPTNELYPPSGREGRRPESTHLHELEIQS